MKDIQKANQEIFSLVEDRRKLRNRIYCKENNRLLDSIDKELARKTGFPICMIGDIFR
jgi:hypothetical protein